jgi:hypothetical protein
MDVKDHLDIFQLFQLDLAAGIFRYFTFTEINLGHPGSR